MSMYRIIIEQIDLITRKKKEWERLHDKTEFDNKKEPQFGYVSTDKEDEEVTTVYTQRTNKEIDLKAVIDAFNKRL